MLLRLYQVLFDCIYLFCEVADTPEGCPQVISLFIAKWKNCFSRYHRYYTLPIPYSILISYQTYRCPILFTFPTLGFHFVLPSFVNKEKDFSEILGFVVPEIFNYFLVFVQCNNPPVQTKPIISNQRWPPWRAFRGLFDSKISFHMVSKQENPHYPCSHHILVKMYKMRSLFFRTRCVSKQYFLVTLLQNKLSNLERKPAPILAFLKMQNELRRKVHPHKNTLLHHVGTPPKSTQAKAISIDGYTVRQGKFGYSITVNVLFVHQRTQQQRGRQAAVIPQNFQMEGRPSTFHELQEFCKFSESHRHRETCFLVVQLSRQDDFISIIFQGWG